VHHDIVAGAEQPLDHRLTELSGTKESDGVGHWAS
jgi:hypothetical protein